MATGSVRKRVYANGHDVWTADYRDHLRKRHIKSFDTKKAAREWLHRTVGEVASGTHAPERHFLNICEATYI